MSGTTQIVGTPGSQPSNNTDLSSLNNNTLFYTQQALNTRMAPASSQELINSTAQQAFNANNAYVAATNQQQQSQDLTANQAVNNYNNPSIPNSLSNLIGSNGSASAATGLISSAIGQLPSSIAIPASQVLQTLSQFTGASASTNATPADQRVRLRPKIGISNIAGAKGTIMYPLVLTNGLMFQYTPTIEWTQQVKYSSQETTHANQDFRAYVNTPALEFTINCHFSAQNNDEATYLLGCLHFLRTVRKMHFGNAVKDNSIGTPPPMLLLSGYGQDIFNDLPVIVTNFSMPMPNDVDYVPVTVGGVKNMVPCVTTINIQCTVQNTPQKLRQFDWNSFANGSLLAKKGWF
jgi:hypothetical protein